MGANRSRPGAAHPVVQPDPGRPLRAATVVKGRTSAAGARLREPQFSAAVSRPAGATADLPASARGRSGAFARGTAVGAFGPHADAFGRWLRAGEPDRALPDFAGR